MWVTVDREMAKHTGAEPGAAYAQFVGGIALGRAEVPDDVAGSCPTWRARTADT